MSSSRSQSAADITTFQQAHQWLYDRIDYERVRPGAQANPFRLDRIRQMLSLLGSPQEKIPAIHIAGTKGKGSTAAMLDSILRASGVRSALFTSPHIVCFEERMRVNGRMPSQEQLTALVQKLVNVLDQNRAVLQNREPTFFEVTTLLAWMYFVQEGAQIVVLETGLGGRLDCTNVCHPLMTIITSIGFDHTHILGNTLELIAGEKAGIIKRGIPVIQGRLPPEAAAVVAAKARDLDSPLFLFGRDFDVADCDPTFSGSSESQGPSGGGSVVDIMHQFDVETPHFRYRSLEIPLAGEHQKRNAALAVMAASIAGCTTLPNVTEQAIREGLRNTWWPLRFECVSKAPTIILDAAHNPDSVLAVSTTLQEDQWQNRRRVLVFASSADKDASAMLQCLVPCFDTVVLTRFLGNPRSTDPEILRSVCEEICPDRMESVSTAPDPATALKRSCENAGEDGLICVTGSIFLASEARMILCGSESPFEKKVL